MPKVTSIRLPDTLVDRLDRIARSLDRPRSWVIRQALEAYVAACVGGDAAPDEPDLSADLPISHQKVIAALEHMIEDAVKHAPEPGASEA